MKRLVVCCDGTWNTPEGKLVTNVVNLARAIRPKARRGVEQVVFYDWGVGTEGGADKLTGGALGKGIDKNIQDAYRFLVHNYNPGDELFLFGFSRGAYTARSLVGLLRNSGLLTKTHAHLIPQAYAMYRSRAKPDVKSARKFRATYSHSQTVNVKFLGVWDTVGALGIPVGILRRFNKKKYNFHDTRISGIVKHAYHALAIDEKREPFRPTIWKTKPGRKNSEQAWFAGVHSDVGGGYPDTGLSYKALVWMVQKAAACGLSVDKGYMASLKMNNSPEKLHNSYTAKYRLLGKYVRPIGRTNTDEFVHPSALARHRNRKGYQPENLKDFLKRRTRLRKKSKFR